MRDDNGQQQQEQEAEEWHCRNRGLIDQIHEIVKKAIVRPANARFKKEKDHELDSIR